MPALRASIKNTELQNLKNPRLRYNPFKNIVLWGCCWSASLQFNLSLSKNAKIVPGNITLKNIASIYIGRKHVWEGKSSCPRRLQKLSCEKQCSKSNVANQNNGSKGAFYKGFQSKFGFLLKIFESCVDSTP